MYRGGGCYVLLCKKGGCFSGFFKISTLPVARANFNGFSKCMLLQFVVAFSKWIYWIDEKCLVQL